ncbi:MAG: helicase C-terminal domain-containing protein [Oscillospiraceae bacterium]
METEKREEWVEKRVKSGLQVLITNPRCVETGLDLNAFTTLIFYSMGYNLFTLRQASRRSWRINQNGAPGGGLYALLRRHYAGQGHEADGLQAGGGRDH